MLFLGDTSPESTSVFYFHNLLRLGCTVYPYNSDALAPRSLWDRAHLRLIKRPTPKRITEENDRILSLVKKYPFDLIFVMNHNFVSVETLHEIRRLSPLGAKIVYHSHDNNFSPGVLTPNNLGEMLSAFDFAFTTKSQNVERYRALGQKNALYVPSAFEPLVHHPISSTRSKIGEPIAVSFVGTFDYSRISSFEAIGWDKLSVWGSNWTKYPNYHQYKNRITPYSVNFLKYADILSQSQMALGLLREEAEDRHTQRTFEIPACGTMQVAPYNEELAAFFKEDEEIVFFRSLDELSSKIKFYLKNPDARNRIASKGRERVFKDDHTYEARVKEILHQCFRKKSFLRPTG